MKDKLYLFFDAAVITCLYGLIFLLPFSIAAVEIFSIAAIIFFIPKKIICPEFKAFKNPADILLFVFFGFMGLSLLNSGAYLHKSLVALVSKWLEYILIFLIAFDMFDEKRVRTAFNLFLLSAGVVCADALSQRFLGVEFIRHKPLIVKSKHGFAAITGPFRYYNLLGSYLVFVSFLAIASLSLVKAKIWKILLILLTFSIFVCLLLTFSRGAWVSFFVVLFLALIFKKRFRELAFICIIFFVVLVIYHPLLERVLFTFTSKGDATRFIIWKAAWKMIMENPWLGKGLGTFMDYFPKYSGTAINVYAHNSFLQIWAESGIFSLLSFLSFIGVVLYRGMAEIRRDDNPLVLGLCLGMAGYLIHAFFDTHLYSLQLAMLFWIALGMIAALCPSSKSIPK